MFTSSNYFYVGDGIQPQMTLNNNTFKEKINSQNGAYFFTYEHPNPNSSTGHWYIMNPYKEITKPVNLLDYGIEIDGTSAIHDLIFVEVVTGATSTMLLQKRRNLSLMLQFRPTYLATAALSTLETLGNRYLSNLLKPRIT